MIQNAKTLPKVFYGLHMVEGLAEYQDPSINNGKPYRILIGEEVIKNMDSTYSGKPVYVRHVNEVNLDKIQEADGFVIESFFNKADGKHWAKFIIVSDKGHEAIRSGWVLSNAYVPSSYSGGGLWHGIEYEKEVMNAQYEHLAIVPNPRYEESIVLTTEEFKAYNEKKELELMKIANSKSKEKKSMFKFWNKSEVKESKELESAMVTLPKSGREVSVSQIVNELDEHEMKKKEDEKKLNMDKPIEEKKIEEKKVEEKKPEEMNSEPKMADLEHHVKIGDETMKLNDLVEKHMKMKDDMEKLKKGEKLEEEPKMNDELADEEAKKKALQLAEHEEKEIEAQKHMNAKGNFDDLKDAPFKALNEKKPLELSEDRMARGKTRYGSN